MDDEEILETARAALEADRQARVKACEAELSKAVEPILKKYRCGLAPSVVIQQGQVVRCAVEIFPFD